MFIAQVLGIDLTFSQIITILFMTILSSIGTPGIPGGTYVILAMVLTSVGIPAEGLALIIGIDRPLDMLRTAVNVTGDATVACIIDK
jgi:Na+/H+-dicarboxylate symporter